MMQVEGQRLELRRGSGGDGRWRGGDGIVREVEVLADSATVSLQTDRLSCGRWGLAGGSPGAAGRNLLIRDGVATELPDKVTFEARKGDISRLETPGGGGWGT